MASLVGTGRHVTVAVLAMVAATLVALLVVAAALVASIDWRTGSGTRRDRSPVVGLRSIPAPGADRPVVRGDRAAWFTSDDYPVEALRRTEEGRVRVRLAVDRRGRARACAIVESSGSAALDEGTCRIFVRRARFEKGHAGSIDMSAVRWVLP